MKAITERPEIAVSVEAVRLLIMRAPIPITDAQVADLTSRLISKFQSIKQDEDGWQFSSVNGSASVALTKKGIQFSVNIPMDAEIALAAISSPIPEVVAALGIVPPIPYGVYVHGSLAPANGTSLDRINSASPLFQRLLPERATLLGGGFRNVFSLDGQNFDCKVETLFINPKRFFISIDANSLGRPATEVAGLVSDLRSKYDLFTNWFAPRVAEEMA